MKGIVPLRGDLRGPIDLVQDRLPAGFNLGMMQKFNMVAATAALHEMKEAGLQPTVKTLNHYLAVFAEALRCVYPQPPHPFTLPHT